ncbi:MAG: hypothetical protein ACXAD7_16130 [Candidatus Kariarchaeaceae archaeon]
MSNPIANWLTENHIRKISKTTNCPQKDKQNKLLNHIFEIDLNSRIQFTGHFAHSLKGKIRIECTKHCCNKNVICLEQIHPDKLHQISTKDMVEIIKWKYNPGILDYCNLVIAERLGNEDVVDDYAKGSFIPMVVKKYPEGINPFINNFEQSSILEMKRDQWGFRMQVRENWEDAIDSGMYHEEMIEWLSDFKYRLDFIPHRIRALMLTKNSNIIRTVAKDTDEFYEVQEVAMALLHDQELLKNYFDKNKRYHDECNRTVDIALNNITDQDFLYTVYSDDKHDRYKRCIAASKIEDENVVKDIYIKTKDDLIRTYLLRNSLNKDLLIQALDDSLQLNRFIAYLKLLKFFSSSVNTEEIVNLILNEDRDYQLYNIIELIEENKILYKIAVQNRVASEFIINKMTDLKYLRLLLFDNNIDNHVVKKRIHKLSNRP